MLSLASYGKLLALAFTVSLLNFSEAGSSTRPAFSCFMGTSRFLLRRQNHFSVLHHSTLPNLTLKRASLTCRMSASSGSEGAQEGDKLLAFAATALANGDLNEARGLIVSAREAYKKVQLTSRKKNRKCASNSGFFSAQQHLFEFSSPVLPSFDVVSTICCACDRSQSEKKVCNFCCQLCMCYISSACFFDFMTHRLLYHGVDTHEAV